MHNLKREKTALEVLATDTYENLIRENSEENIDHLN